MKRRLSFSLAAAATLTLSSCSDAPGTALAQNQAVVAQPVAGQNCVGLIEIEIKQSSFTLDLTEHWRNNANATRMQMPVLPSDYRALREGQELQSDFRSGSFWLNGGKISSRDITVQRKIGYICEAPQPHPAQARTP